MKFFTIAALFAATAIAGPLEVRTGSGSICPTGLYSNPQCCSAQVLGIIGLDCQVRKCKQTSYRAFWIEYILIDVPQLAKHPVTASTSKTSAPRTATSLFAVSLPL